MEDLRHPAGSSSQVIVRLDDGHALMADVAVKGGLWSTLLRPLAGGTIIVLISMLLLSVYAVRWVIAPLADVARAATSFGRSPRAPEVLRRRGPLEIAGRRRAERHAHTYRSAARRPHPHARRHQS
ncbi:hypothetical protein ACVWZM_007623 [Bradyrhizobium sp. USDA 4501]